MRSFVLLIYGLSCGLGLLRPAATATAKLPVTGLEGAGADADADADAFMLTGVQQAVKELNHRRNDSLLLANMVTHQRGIGNRRDSQTDEEVAELKNFTNEVNEARGRHKRRKMLKYLQPLLIGFVIVKFIIFPLVLKTLTALSTSSFVMSKIALAIAGLLVLKWLISGSGDGGGYDGSAKERTHFEIVHLPIPLTKLYHRGSEVGGGGGIGGWDDLSLSGSNSVFTVKHPNKPHKYIPVGNVKEIAHVVAAAAVADAAENGDSGYRNVRPVFNAKPFL